MKMYALSNISVVDFISASVIFVVRVSLLHKSTINCRSFSTSIAHGFAGFFFVQFGATFVACRCTKRRESIIISEPFISPLLVKTQKRRILSICSAWIHQISVSNAKMVWNKRQAEEKNARICNSHIADWVHRCTHRLLSFSPLHCFTLRVCRVVSFTMGNENREGKRNGMKFYCAWCDMNSYAYVRVCEDVECFANGEIDECAAAMVRLWI